MSTLPKIIDHPGLLPPQRRSARLTTVSTTTDHYDDDREENVKPPPGKKRRGQPKKETVIESAGGNVLVKAEMGLELDVKPDISSLSNAQSGPSTFSQEQPNTVVKNEQGVISHTKPNHSTLVARCSATVAQDAAKPTKKRGRPSKADLLARSNQASTTMSTTVIKQEIEVAPTAGSSQVKAEPSQGVSGSQLKTDILPPAKEKSKAKKAIDPKRERLARVRAKCPATILARYQRAISQRMFMLEREKADPSALSETFRVLGSTGNVYTVNIGSLPLCDCPDCEKGNMPCKHIIFVFIKVLKVPDDSSAWYQKSLTHDELEEVFSNAPPTPSGSVAVSAHVQAAYYQATGKGKAVETTVLELETGPGSKRKDAIGEDCPVCYEEMTQEDEDLKKLTYDVSLVGCGRPLHSQCFEMWAMTARRAGNPVTCVWCRADWPTGDVAGKGKGKSTGNHFSSGYINMADVAGLSRERDVSTYHWPNRFRGMD